jgi:hypothetical protein
LIMSTGWITVVAVMPARPPLTKGRATRIKGVCRKLVVACFGFSAADFMAEEASERTASLDCFALSRARVAGILMVADMAVRSAIGIGEDVAAGEQTKQSEWEKQRTMGMQLGL